MKAGFTDAESVRTSEGVEDRDGYVAYEWRDDGVYVTLFPAVGQGRPVSLEELQEGLLERGLADLDPDQMMAVWRESGKAVKVSGPLPDEMRRDATVKVYVSDDELKAFCDYDPPFGGEHLSEQGVRDCLREASVLQGLVEENVVMLAGRTSPARGVVVAQGKEAVHGEDGETQFLIDLDQSELRPKELEDGRVDYRELRTIFFVEKGQPLVKRIPPRPGEDGFTVTGRIIKAREGRAATITPGKGVGPSEGDPDLLIALEDGYPTRAGKKFSVLPLFVVEKDVDFSVGNIFFKGNVLVRGRILSGFKVVATGNVEVDGRVEDAYVKAEGDILIRGGVVGRQKAHIEAGGAVKARFIEAATVVAAGEVRVGEGILHSFIFAGEKVVLEGRHGTISGGEVNAHKEILTKTAGSPMGTATQLAVGVKPDVDRRLRKVKEDIDSLQKAMERIQTSIRGLGRSAKVMPTSDTPEGQTLVRLTRTKKQLYNRLKKLADEKKELEEQVEPFPGAKILVTAACHPGVRVRVLEHIHTVEEEKRRASFFVREDELRVDAPGR